MGGALALLFGTFSCWNHCVKLSFEKYGQLSSFSLFKLMWVYWNLKLGSYKNISSSILPSVLMVYFSEFFNEIAARNWYKFSKHQYFDSNGLFISVIFSCPILVNCLLMLARFLNQSFQLLAKVKTVQLKQNMKQKLKKQELQENRSQD